MSRRPHGKAPRPAMDTTHLWGRHPRHLARWMLLCALAITAAAVVVSMTGCAQAREVCGTLPDGTEYCTIVKGAV